MNIRMNPGCPCCTLPTVSVPQTKFWICNQACNGNVIHFGGGSSVPSMVCGWFDVNPISKTIAMKDTLHANHIAVFDSRTGVLRFRALYEPGAASKVFSASSTGDDGGVYTVLSNIYSVAAEPNGGYWVLCNVHYGRKDGLDPPFANFGYGGEELDIEVCYLPPEASSSHVYSMRASARYTVAAKGNPFTGAPTIPAAGKNQMIRCSKNGKIAVLAGTKFVPAVLLWNAPPSGAPTIVKLDKAAQTNTLEMDDVGNFWVCGRYLDGNHGFQADGIGCGLMAFDASGAFKWKYGRTRQVYQASWDSKGGLLVGADSLQTVQSILYLRPQSDISTESWSDYNLSNPSLAETLTDGNASTYISPAANGKPYKVRLGPPPPKLYASVSMSVTAQIKQVGVPVSGHVHFDLHAADGTLLASTVTGLLSTGGPFVYTTPTVSMTVSKSALTNAQLWIYGGDPGNTHICEINRVTVNYYLSPYSSFSSTDVEGGGLQKLVAATGKVKWAIKAGAKQVLSSKDGTQAFGFDSGWQVYDAKTGGLKSSTSAFLGYDQSSQQPTASVPVWDEGSNGAF